MRYAKVALGLHIYRLFDYLIPENYIPECSVGARVAVPFSMQILIGFVVALSPKTNIAKVRPITKLIDPKPILDTRFLELTKIVSEYYCSPWGQTIQSALPPGVRAGMPVNITGDEKSAAEGKTTDSKISFYQAGSFEERFKMYCVNIEKAMGDKKSVIVLSPEINLCLKIYGLLGQRYPQAKIAVTYRKQKINEELRLWEKAKNGGLDILIGTRPEVFAPLPNIGLIILEEEDGYGYKEEQSPYYHAREVADMRAAQEGCELILAGKTPTLESYYRIKTKQCQLISQPDSVKRKPEIKIVDMRQYGFSKQKGSSAISPVLDDRIHKALETGKKIIIFANRKGFAHSVYCSKCGLILQCDKCSSRLSFYREQKKLICNLCGSARDMPSICPQCSARYIKYKGTGAERIKSQLHLSYPQAKICQLDKEQRSRPADFHILIATEMLFHSGYALDADIVAALDLDGALNIINFRANERLYSLVYRLRNIAKDELIIQTRMPEYYRREEIINFNLEKLFDLELKERKALGLPPFSHLAQINLRGKDPERVKKTAFDIYEKLMGKDRKVAVFEPSEAMPLKLRGNYRFRILMKAKNAASISNFLSRHLEKLRRPMVITTIEMDPQ